MNIADEASSAHLNAIVHPESTVATISLKAAVDSVNISFKRWGLPRRIKIDNGLPFVNPKYRDLPTLAKLWWIGLGIEVIQNRPLTPQENGVVECLQGIICSWVNPKQHPHSKSLQKRINQESDFQRNHYQIPAKGNKTRIEIYPELEENNRVYHPDNFNMNLVYEYLSQFVWYRSIKKSGMVGFNGEPIYVGYKFAYLPITVSFDPSEKVWLFRKTDGTLLKTSSKGVYTEEQIKEFSIMSMNL